MRSIRAKAHLVKVGHMLCHTLVALRCPCVRPLTHPSTLYCSLLTSLFCSGLVTLSNASYALYIKAHGGVSGTVSKRSLSRCFVIEILNVFIQKAAEAHLNRNQWRLASPRVIL